MSLRIMYVEDDPQQVQLLQDAATAAGVDLDVAGLADADTAIDHLELAQDGEEPKPDAVMVDLDLVTSRGEEVLRYVRGSMLHVPVIVLTGSKDAKDSARCADLDASAYFVKPSSLEGFMQIMRTVQSLVRSAH